MNSFGEHYILNILCTYKLSLGHMFDMNIFGENKILEILHT